MRWILGAAHWIAGHVFGIDWCDRCGDWSRQPPPWSGSFTTDAIVCYECWLSRRGEAA